MYKLILAGFLYVWSLSALAQSKDDAFRPSPLFVDQSGNMSDNWIDPDYSPIAPVKLAFDVGTSYLPGNVFMKDGSIQEGLLKYTSNGRKLIYKPRLQYNVDGKRIKADNCLGFTILKDTFTVIQDFSAIKKRGEFSLSDRVKLINFNKAEFVEVLGETDGCSIYKFIDITNNGQNVNTYFLIHNGINNEVIDVSETNKNWRSDIKPLLKNGGHISKPEDKKFRLFFKEQEFAQKSNANKRLLFSPYMVELDDSLQTMYQAEIEKKLYWQLMFHSNSGDSIMRHTYKSVLPYEKYGTSTYYYPNGFIRKNVINKEGRGIAEKRYHNNGYLHYDIVQNTIEKKTMVLDLFKKLMSKRAGSVDGNPVYQSKGEFYDAFTDEAVVSDLRKNFSEPKDEDDLRTFYLSVCDSLGNNLLDTEGDGVEKVYDESRQCFCYNTFVENLLSESYYLNEDGDKVYLYCDRPIKAKEMKNASQLYDLKQQLLMINWDIFPRGTVLMRFVIDKDGLVRKTEVINAYDKNFKRSIEVFIARNLSRQIYRPAKHKGEKVMVDMVVPLYIGVYGYGPVPSVNNSWMMQQQMQQMRMMQMNSFRPPVSF